MNTLTVEIAKNLGKWHYSNFYGQLSFLDEDFNDVEYREFFTLWSPGKTSDSIIYDDKIYIENVEYKTYWNGDLRFSIFDTDELKLAYIHGAIEIFGKINRRSNILLIEWPNAIKIRDFIFSTVSEILGKKSNGFSACKGFTMSFPAISSVTFSGKDIFQSLELDKINVREFNDRI